MAAADEPKPVLLPSSTRAQGTVDPSAVAGDHGTADGFPVAPASGGRYLLGDEIARGGMGAIHRATDTTLALEVALKVLQEKDAADSHVARRFADEARITAQLQHPAIPPVHDLGTLPDGRPFLAMKLIKGRTLNDRARTCSTPTRSASEGLLALAGASGWCAAESRTVI